MENGHWESNGIRGRGPKAPSCAGLHKGLATVIGTGRSMWDDLARFDPGKYRAHTLAVNHAILHYKPRLFHAVSLHPEEPYCWRAMRGCYQTDASYVNTHSIRKSKEFPVDYVWDIEAGTLGTSGFFAVLVALALGFNRVVLLGVPTDGSGHFWDPPDTGWNDVSLQAIRKAWIDTGVNDYFQGRVRSMSGWTREVLGEPDPQWLKGE